MNWNFLFFYLCFLLSNAEYRPVVLLHGLLGDATSMAAPKQWIEEDYPGVYVKNVEIGNGRWDSLFMEINSQVEDFAYQIQKDPKLKNGFNLIGHSQGGLITRAYIERYNNPPVYNYISWEGPNEGVYGMPGLNGLCPDVDCPWLAEFMDSLLDLSWSRKEVQEHWTFATYWKDPFNYNLYLDTNTFLADINNERSTKNETYRENMISLNEMLLIVGSLDDIVVPVVSPFFSFWKLNSDTELVPWNETQAFKEDWIGLSTLQKQGKVQRHTIKCGHLNTSRPPCKEWYQRYTAPLLNNTLPV